jgi:hypothetical protein
MGGLGAGTPFGNQHRGQFTPEKQHLPGKQPGEVTHQYARRCVLEKSVSENANF